MPLYNPKTVITGTAGSNTAPSYEEGTWTPALTFATPGNLNVAYTTQLGRYKKIGNMVVCSFSLQTSTFTYTSASGTLQITGLPFTHANNSLPGVAAVEFAGITKASYTQYTAQVANNNTLMFLNAHGSGQAQASIASTDTASGTQVFLRGTITYFTA